MGSLEAVTDAAGKTLTVLGHDPHGERRNDWASQLTPTQIGTLLDGHGERVSRGFTGHEHLDRTGLIHMNGRIYDPRLGRFLSPDPIVGDPTSSQSWNLYSYVGNNPLSYVDPTGLVQAGPMCPVYGPAMCMAGSGAGTGGSTARTATVTFTVYGVAAVPYLRAEPAWTQVWDIDRYVWDVTYDHFWDVAHVPFSRDVTVTIAFEEQSVADQPADSGGLGIAAADVGASILVPGLRPGALQHRRRLRLERLGCRRRGDRHIGDRRRIRRSRGRESWYKGRNKGGNGGSPLYGCCGQGSHNEIGQPKAGNIRYTSRRNIVAIRTSASREGARESSPDVGPITLMWKSRIRGFVYRTMELRPVVGRGNVS